MIFQFARDCKDFISALSLIYYAYMSVLIVVCYTAVFSVCVA